MVVAYGLKVPKGLQGIKGSWAEGGFVAENCSEISKKITAKDHVVFSRYLSPFFYSPKEILSIAEYTKLHIPSSMMPATHSIRLMRL